MRARLKRATDDLHRRLEAPALFGSLLEPGLTSQRYRDLMLAQWRVHAAVEARRQSLSVWPALNLSRLLAALERDLGRAGCRATAEPASIRNMDAEGMLGALYVLHGARFGSGVIGPVLADTLPGAPRSFFNIGPDPALWRTVLAALARSPDSSEPSLVRGARAVFGALEHLADEERRATGARRHSVFGEELPRRGAGEDQANHQRW